LQQDNTSSCWFAPILANDKPASGTLVPIAIEEAKMAETPNKGLFRGWFAPKKSYMDFSGMTPEQTQQALTAVMVRDMLKERASDRRWRGVRRALTVLLILAGLGLYLALFFYEPRARPLLPGADGYIGVVRIDGVIKNSSDASATKVIPALGEAFADPSVKAVVVAIDSPGGAPAEAERINYALGELKKRYNKPVYAVIENLGASAGYMIAMNTDKVYAGKYSLVGSIGAVLQSWDVHEAINKRDVVQTVYASGALKNMLNPFSPPTEAAGKKAQELVDITGGQFLADFKARRGSKLKEGVTYNTGEIWSGEQAIKLGLVDETGTIEHVAYAANANVKMFKTRSRSPLALLTAESAGEWLSTVLGKAARSVVAESGSVELR
jgi:protease IV